MKIHLFGLPKQDGTPVSAADGVQDEAGRTDSQKLVWSKVRRANVSLDGGAAGSNVGGDGQKQPNNGGVDIPTIKSPATNPTPSPILLDASPVLATTAPKDLESTPSAASLPDVIPTVSINLYLLTYCRALTLIIAVDYNVPNSRCSSTGIYWSQ